jgi:signal transduction histidine kinase/ActR/RegA family two-component response regulator
LDHLLNRLTPYTPQLLIVLTIWYAMTQLCLDQARRRTRKKLIEETERREKAEGANRAKAVFLTSMSHEIRTPLNAIVGFTDLALRTPLNAELREYLGTVRASADWLTHVVNEILDFARIEAGAVQLSCETFALREILQSAINMAAPLAAQRNLTLRLHLDAALPTHLQGDSTRLLQVVFNLIDNAVKFTTSGSVLVNAVQQRCDSDTVTVRIAVADTGIGISPERLEYLFEPLSKPAASLDLRSRTCGFGLPICQRLVSLMGGNIEVRSRPGIGSTFAFALSFQSIPHKPVAEKSAAQPLARRRLQILVADDNASSRLLATVLLQGAGHQVTEAVTGIEALKFFTAGYFDLVLMDVEMPELNGVEATKAIRATEPAGRTTPIYALTAHAAAGDEHRCLQAGMTGFLTKPLSVDSLLRLASQIGASAPDHHAVSSDEGCLDRATGK